MVPQVAKLKKQKNIFSYIFFLSGRSIYLVLISSKLAIIWLKESRSITKQITPLSSSQIILAVLFSSLKKLKENSFCKQTADKSDQFHENFREIDFTEKTSTIKIKQNKK